MNLILANFLVVGICLPVIFLKSEAVYIKRSATSSNLETLYQEQASALQLLQTRVALLEHAGTLLQAKLAVLENNDSQQDANIQSLSTQTAGLQHNATQLGNAVSALERSESKQSSDIHSLQTKSGALEQSQAHQDAEIQQLLNKTTSADSSKIHQNSDELRQLQARTAVLEHYDRQRSGAIQSLQNQVSALEHNKQATVAFTASLTNLHATTSSPFMFSHVITNKEQGYDQHTGVFTAPVDGVYAFFLHLVHDHGTHDVVLATIYKADGGQELCWTSAHALQAPNAYDEGSCAATTRLTKGQRVYVKRKAGGNGYSVTFAWFSGFLIGPDV